VVEGLLQNCPKPPVKEHVQPRGAKRKDSWKSSILWQDVPGKDVSAFFKAYRSHPEAIKSRSTLIAQYIDAQLAKGRLVDWTVLLVSNDDESKEDPAVVAGHKVGMLGRKHSGDKRPDGPYVIGRLVNPKDEAVDFGAEDYAEALKETQEAWTLDRGRSKRTEPPDKPSGPALRARRPVDRALLLLYPLDPKPTGVPGQPVIGFAASFPADGMAATVTYRVNNVYSQQEFGEDP
jgi:hypothetical protein